MKRRTLNEKAKAPQELPGADERVARAVFVALLHSRLARFSTDSRNRISRHVTEATRSGALVYVSPRTFRFGDAADWARRKWPSIFRDFPLKENIARAHLVVPAFRVAGRGNSLPTTIAECHGALIRAYRLIGKLEAEVALLRPAYDRLEAARRHGKKGGRPRKT